MLQLPQIKRSRGVGLRKSETVSIPAPVGGWNVHDPVAKMPETDAIVLENFFPRASSVDLRPGSAHFATGLAATPKTLMAYNSGSASKLFAATDTGIYEVTSGTPSASLIAVSSGRLQYTNFATAAGSYLLACNGTDELRLYDGTTWIAINGASTPAITGILTSDFVNVAALKKRLWFAEKNALSAWYLAAGAIGGAATEFPLGQVFSRGGYLVSIGSWTIDGGDGSDDYGVFVSSEGEVAIYKGTDPASDATWTLVGVYFIGEPVGFNCLSKYGGDLLYLCQNGLFPLSKALQSTTVDYKSALTTKIDTAFTEAMSTYGSNEGWSIAVFPQGSFVLVSIPITDTYTIQYVMNSITGAWTVFTGWFATSFEVFDKKLYFSSSYDAVPGQGAVKQAWTGLDDCGIDIVGLAQAAYSALRARGRVKHVRMIRPLIKIAVATEIRYALSTDFRTAADSSILNIGGISGSLWGTGTWGTAIWGGHGVTTAKQWQTAFVDEGYYVSIRLQVSTHASSVEWLATDYMYEIGGPL